MEQNRTSESGVFGLRLFLWSWLIMSGASILVRLSFVVLPHLVQHAEYSEDSWTIVDWFQTLSMVRLGIDVVVLALCGFGLFSYARAVKRHNVQGLLNGALAGCAIGFSYLAFHLLVFHLGFSEGVRSDSGWALVQRWGWMVGLAGETAMLVMLLLAMAKVSTRLRGALSPVLTTVTLVVLVVHFILPLIQYLVPVTGVEGEYFRLSLMVLGLVLGAGLMVLIYLLFHRHLVYLSTASDALDERPDSEHPFRLAPWPTVRWGLATYRAGLLAKLFLVLAGFSLLMVAFFGRSQEFARGVLVFLAIAGPLTSCWMIVGLLAYAQVPRVTGGRAPALVALAVLVVGLLGDFYSLTLVFRLFSDNLSAIYAVMKQAPYVEGISQALGLLGIMALLFSFKRVGSYAGDERIGQRVGRVAGLLFVVSLCAIGFRVLIAQRVLRGYWPIPLGLLVLIAAIVALTMYLGLLKRLRLAIGSFSRAASFD